MKNAILNFLTRLGIVSAEAVEVTLEDVTQAVYAVDEARDALEASIADAHETVKAHNESAAQTITALSNEIAKTQSRIDTANALVAPLEPQDKAA